MSNPEISGKSTVIRRRKDNVSLPDASTLKLKKLKEDELIVIGYVSRESIDGKKLEEEVAGTFIPLDKKLYDEDVKKLAIEYDVEGPWQWKNIRVNRIALYELIYNHFGGDPFNPETVFGKTVLSYVNDHLKERFGDVLQRVEYFPSGNNATPLDHVNIDCFFAGIKKNESRVYVGIDVCMKGRKKEDDVANEADLLVNEFPKETEPELKFFVRYYGERVMDVLESKM